MQTIKIFFMTFTSVIYSHLIIYIKKRQKQEKFRKSVKRSLTTYPTGRDNYLLKFAIACIKIYIPDIMLNIHTDNNYKPRVVNFIFKISIFDIYKKIKYNYPGFIIYTIK